MRAHFYRNRNSFLRRGCRLFFKYSSQRAYCHLVTNILLGIPLSTVECGRGRCPAMPFALPWRCGSGPALSAAQIWAASGHAYSPDSASLCISATGFVIKSDPQTAAVRSPMAAPAPHDYHYPHKKRDWERRSPSGAPLIKRETSVRTGKRCAWMGVKPEAEVEASTLVEFVALAGGATERR